MFKFKINEQQIASIEAKVKADVREILASSAVLNEIGGMATDRLRFQARTAKPFNEGASFPVLKDSTIENRKYLEKYNKTHKVYERQLSNLTITGAFLESLTWLVKGPGLLELFFEGRHPGYRLKNGNTKNPPRNQDLFKWLTDKGFAVFDSSIETNKIIKARIRSIVLKYIRRGLKVRNALDD